MRWQKTAPAFALVVLWAQPAGVVTNCDASRYSYVIGIAAHVERAKSPHVLEPLRMVTETARLPTPLVCEYTYGFHAVPHIITPRAARGVFQPVVFMPYEFTSNLSFDEFVGVFAHEVAHIVRDRIPKTQGQRAREERETDLLAATWVGEEKVAAGLRAAMRIAYELKNPLLTLRGADMQRVIDLELAVATRKKSACEREFSIQTRTCRGGEGRDDDACFMRIKREYEKCSAPRAVQEASAQ